MLDAEILLYTSLNKTRAYLYANPQEELSTEEQKKANAFVSERLSGKPIAYIIGHKEFYSLDFMVTKDCLIPRPETEILVELALEYAANNPQSTLDILDLGTGSGNIAISIAKHLHNARIIAVDISAPTLDVAKTNAKRLNVNNVSFQASDYFDNLTKQTFDLIVSNPPYIDKRSPYLEQNVSKFEPEKALISEDNGYYDLKKILHTATNWLNNHGVLLLEMGHNQHQKIVKEMQAVGYKDINIHYDLQKIPRSISAVWYTRSFGKEGTSS